MLLSLLRWTALVSVGMFFYWLHLSGPAVYRKRKRRTFS